MSKKGEIMSNIFQSSDVNLLKAGKYASLTVAFLTIITFIFAMIAIPISGANAPVDTEFSYPFLNTLKQFPGDFIWQYFAMIQIISFLIFINIIKINLPSNKQLYANISSHFALLSSGVLLINYYCQVMVIPSSLAANNTEGIGLIIQYNPYGLFIAMEELGYILMSMSLFSIAPIFSKKSNGFTVKLTIIIASILAFISFVSITAIYGVNKLDRFEVAIMTITWFSLIIVGILVNRLFNKEEKCIATRST